MAEKPRKVGPFTPYYTEEQAGQVRAAFVAAGKAEGDASVSDFIIRATMREVKRLQRKYNGGKPWPAVKAGELRRGQRTMDEMQHRNEEP
jgi:Centromere-binding protein ParB C-terminal